MSTFNRDPSLVLSVDDALDLVERCRVRRFAYFNSKVEVFPKSFTRLPRIVRRRRLELLTATLAVTWLLLPRASVSSLLCLAGAVAVGRAAWGRRRRRRG